MLEDCALYVMICWHVRKGDEVPGILILQGRQNSKGGRQLDSRDQSACAAGCLLSKSKSVNDICVAHTEC